MKTYLKDLTPDEVIRRLKAGESIKYDTSDAETKYCDGILLTIRHDGGYTINVQIRSCLNRVAYFETPDELKLEVGKCYKTRDGRKAFITIVNENDLVSGVIENDNSIIHWHKDGVHTRTEKEHDLDVVAEWSDEDVEND